VGIALTGTPIENKLSDLWSLFEFINPGLLGSFKEFSEFIKQIESKKVQCYAPLRSLVAPYILRRLKTDKSIIQDLPDKTELTTCCSLSKKQIAFYQEAVSDLKSLLEETESDAIERKGRILSFIIKFKQICNHPSQYSGDDGWEAMESGKFQRLKELIEVIKEKQEKVLVFTQFKEMTEPLHNFLERLFGGEGCILHGQAPIKKRQEMMEQF